MGNEIYLILAVLITGFAALLFFINRKIGNLNQRQKPSDELLEWLKTTSLRMDEQNKTFNGTLRSSTQSLNERLDNASRVIVAVQKNIGEMSEIGRSMRQLQDFLQSPKLRGNIGEQVLKELLGQMLPKSSFFLQYTFKSGGVVDAAIKTTAGLIPVDSKFPMENFRKLNSAESEKERNQARKEFGKDVKKHIDDIARKYILTDEGTIDYALMYIPSEAVYYEIVNDNELFDYAGKKRILPVSPMTFYAYMKAILMSFEGQKIEAKARQILTSIRAIQKDYTKTEDSLSVLGKHLQNAYNQMSNVFSVFGKLGQKLSSAQSLGEEEETKQLDVKQEEKIK